MGLRLNTPPVEVFDLGTTEVFVTENSRASLSRWFKPDSKWHFFFRSTLYHISEMASKMALFGCFRFMELAEIGRCRASVPPPQTPEGGGLPFRSCFRSSSSAAVPQQFRSSSAAAPKQLRSSPAAALRSSSVAAPQQQLRSSSAAAPQSFRVTSEVVPCYLRSSTDETPASPPPSAGYAHGGRLCVAEVRPPPRQRSRARVSRREPRDGRVRWRGE